jgi:hypothetical protein
MTEEEGPGPAASLRRWQSARAGSQTGGGGYSGLAEDDPALESCSSPAQLAVCDPSNGGNGQHARCD